MTRHRVAVTLAVAATVAGCGGEDAPEVSERLVDSGQPAPLINAFDRAENGAYLLTTNRGFFRIDAKAGKASPVSGSVQLQGASSTVGRFLELSTTDTPGVLLGSGHPDQPEGLPPYLGFMRSDDAGRSWRVLSRAGEADLHEIVEIHGRLYAFDAVKGALLISEDGGRTFAERFTPKGLLLSLAVDPGDPRRVVISTDDQIHRSADEGRTWRPVASTRGPRVAWPEGGPLLRTDADGSVMRSDDAGGAWKPVGRIEAGEPYKLLAFSPERLASAMSDGTIVESGDGGKSWRTVFRP